MQGPPPQRIADRNEPLRASATFPAPSRIGPSSRGDCDARVVGHCLYVTSTKDLEIYDISPPADPQLVSRLTVDVEYEQVPTNGAVLASPARRRVPPARASARPSIPRPVPAVWCSST